MVQDYSKLGRRMAVLGWTAVIFVASSDAFSSGGSGGILARLIGHLVSQDLLAAINFLIRKAAHLIAYGILGVLADRAEQRVSVAMLIALLVAVTDEWHQSTTAMRSGSPFDVLLDLFGAAVAIATLRRRSG